MAAPESCPQIGMMVSDLKDVCINEMGRKLSDNCGPGFKELASKLFSDNKDIQEALGSGNCDNPGAKVVKRYGQMADATVLALKCYLQELGRMDVIRIMRSHIEAPCSFVYVVKEKHAARGRDSFIYMGTVKFYHKEIIKDAVSFIQCPELQSIPFNDLAYASETVIAGNIGDTECSTFKGKQLTMIGCSCNRTEPEFRARAPTAPQVTRPKVHVKARMCISDNISKNNNRKAMQPAEENIYESLNFEIDDTKMNKDVPVHRVDSGMSSTHDFGDGMFGSVSHRSAGIRSGRRDSDFSDDSGRSSVTRYSKESTFDRLSPDSLEDPTEQLSHKSMSSRGSDASELSACISLHSDAPSTMLDAQRVSTDDAISSDYMRVPGEDSVYENVEPPAFHPHVQTKAEIAAVLDPYKSKDNYFFTRRSREKPNICRTICATYNQAIVHYRIHIVESVMQGKTIQQYTLYGDKGPLFSSVYELYLYYQVTPMGGVPSGQGPRMLHPVHAKA